MAKGDVAPEEGYFLSTEDFIALANRMQDLQMSNAELRGAYALQDRALNAAIANAEMWKEEASKGRGVGDYAKLAGAGILTCGFTSYFVTKAVHPEE